MEGKKEECENRRSQDQSQIEGREKQKKKEEGKKEKQQAGQTEAFVKGGSSLFIKVNGRGYSPL